MEEKIMLCERAQQIFNAMRNKQDIPVSDREVSELVQLNCIAIFTSDRTIDVVNNDIATTRDQFNTVTNSIRQNNRDILAVEREQATGSLGTRLSATLNFGAGKELKRRAEQLNIDRETFEKEIGLVKKRLLDLSVEKETVERAVKIDGHRAILTPMGERLIIEIDARPRLATSDLASVNGKLAQLDNAFSSAISRIDGMMQTSTFPSIWSPFFVSIGIPGPEIDQFQAMRMNMPDYEETSMDPQLLDYSTSRMLNGLQGAGQMAPNATSMEMQNIYNEIINLLMTRTTAALVYATPVIRTIAKMLASWSPAMSLADQAVAQLTGQATVHIAAEESIVADRQTYMNNLHKLLNAQVNRVQGDPSVPGVPSALQPRDPSMPALDPIDEQDEVFMVLLLALAKQPKNYDYFLDTFKEIAQGRKIFAAIAALFPWDARETWMVLLRAESSIQRGQSAKFVPELIEYALLLSLNPEILAIENNISPAQLAAWKYLVIPSIQATVLAGLEGRIESYIRSRPLSYITYPRYYHHHHLHQAHLHYHTTG
jgi:hypothetical protein